jgi:hypothetical protein
MPTIVKQPWAEYDAWSGCKPDGYSVHLSESDRVAFVDGFDKTFNNEAQVPDNYDKAVGNPTVIDVPDHVHQALVAVREDKTHDYPWRAFGIFVPNDAAIMKLGINPNP